MPNAAQRSSATSRVLRSIRWPGNKSSHLKWLLPLLPECAHYVEPFCGSAAVLLNRPISREETCNDLDGEMVNYLKIVREQPNELRRLLDRTPYSRVEFTASLTSNENLTSLERARRFYVRVMQSHFGFSVNALPSHWETPKTSTNGTARASSRFRSGLARFDELASRLSRVSFESRPATAVIAAMDDTDKLFYCDPPYVTETWTRTDKSYTNVMNDDDHRDLARIINDCRGKVAISGYESALYADLFPATRWRKLLAPPKSSRASGRMRQEILWCNFGEDGEQIRPSFVNGATLENPTLVNPEIDALVAKIKLLAMDAQRAKDRSHRAVHNFLAEVYGLAHRLRENEMAFVDLMRAEGIKKPDIDLLYYQTAQIFQSKELRSHPDWKADASRTARALVQAEARGYTQKNFVQRIEQEEVMNGRRLPKGVAKLIRFAQLSKGSEAAAATADSTSTTAPEASGAASAVLSAFLDKALPVRELLVAMTAAADAAEIAGVTLPDLRVVLAASGEGSSSPVRTNPSGTARSLKSHRKTRKSGKARNNFDILSRPARLLAFNHPAITERRTVYPKKVVVPSGKRVLIAGENNAKTGPRIEKGMWAGLRIYTLTLEERATCSSACEHWRSCFGNNMQWADRFQVGPELDDAIRRDVAELTIKHPAGIAVRLHVLGDFHSPAYVQLWAELLRKHVTLRVFGFSRRWDAGDPIADALRELMQEQPERFDIRLSNAPPELGPSTVTVECEAPTGAIICPAQTHKTATCSTCALCWSTDKQIAFIQH